MKTIYICLVFTCVLAIGVVFSDSASAVGGWNDGPASVLKTKSIDTLPDRNCLTARQEFYITELQQKHSVCFQGNGTLKIGSILYYGASRAVVKFAYSSEVHLLDGICEGFTCLFSAETDTLVTFRRVSQYSWGLVVYKNVSERIKESFAAFMPTWYVFDASQPDLELKNDVGALTSIQSFSLSENGKWIVVELRDHGIAVINTDTLAVRQVLTEGSRYGHGMDPDQQLAISNDGKSVVVSGFNAGFSIVDVTPTCGQQLIGDLRYQSGSTRCRSGDLEIGILFPRLKTIERPRFIGDGRNLEVIVISYLSGAHRVTLARQGTPLVQQLRFLSLGDSFSSGEGETDDRFYLNGTNDGFNTCHVSSRAYPSIIASRLGANDSNAKNVACSGARIPDIIGSSYDYSGQGNRLGSSGMNLSDDERMTAKEQAVETFQPGKVPQATFIDRYNPENITIGVGGNDAGLMGKLRTCAMPGVCEWAIGDGILKTAGEIERLYDTLIELHSRLRTISQDARVFVVGYPQIIDPDGNCDVVTAFLIQPPERHYIQQSITYLNKVIKAAATSAGFTYVDIENSMAGRKLCHSTMPLAMNGLRLGNDISIFKDVPMLRIIGAETFHPTPTGHQLMADDFLRQYDAAPPAEPSGNGAPERGTYWNQTPSNGTIAEAYMTDFANRDSAQPSTLKIQLPKRSLRPLSSVTFEIRSDQTVLGTTVVDTHGAVDTEVILPESLSDGFHTLHVFGTNREGHAVDLYQFITVGSPGEPPFVSEPGDLNQPPVTTIQTIGGPLFSLASPEREPLVVVSNDFANSTNGAVLGAQSTTPHTASIAEPLTVIPGLIKKLGAPLLWMWIVGVGLFVGSLLVSMLIILVRRRWAKRWS